MSRLLRFLMWLLLTALVVWVVVIGYWKIVGVRPDVRALVLYLGVLPLGTFAVLALLKHGLANARSKASNAQADSLEAAGDDAATGGDAPAGEPATPVGILASAVQLPAGSDVASVLGAIGTPAAPQLHQKLKDGSGYPVFASWIDDVDTDAVMQAFEAAGGKHADIRRLPEEQLRAFGLMLPVTQDLLAEVVAEDWLAAPLPSVSGGRSTAPPPPRLQASILLPSEWTSAIRELAVAWFVEEARAAGILAGQLVAEVIPASGSDEVWRHLSKIALPSSPPSPAPVLHLVLACHSQLGERSVQRLDQAGQLLSAMRSEGIVPGEGAAGVLLLAADADGGFALPPKAVLRAHATMRQGVSWQPRTAVQQMEDLFGQVLARAPGATSDEVKAMVSDADLRKSRATAVAGFMDRALEHLDPESDCMATGSSCGHAGIVSPLSLIALAAERAAANDQPVLAVAVAEPDQRTIALVSPPDSPAADETAESSSNPQAT
ncbi:MULTISPECIES: hypothetical protein [unclassified Luteimonas]